MQAIGSVLRCSAYLPRPVHTSPLLPPVFNIVMTHDYASQGQVYHTGKQLSIDQSWSTKQFQRECVNANDYLIVEVHNCFPEQGLNYPWGLQYIFVYM